MKKIVYILLVILVVSCDSESANDCFQKTGNIIQETVPVESFDKILVNRDVALILKEGSDFEVIIETGENLRNDIEVKVVNNELQLTDNNTCNYVRAFGATKIYVTAPDITEIRSSTQYDISSDGTLNFEILKLLSEDFNAEGTFTIGDFRLDVNSKRLSIAANNISSFHITGQTENLFVSFFSGSGRFEGENLIAQNIDVYHRGSNDMIINPQQTLTGELRGTGDVISLNNPPTVMVEELYTGRLLFN